MEFTNHTTIEGERFDQIATNYFGDGNFWEYIIQDNPDVPLYDSFPGGIKLKIRVIEIEEIKTNLPPWKQS